MKTSCCWYTQNLCASFTWAASRHLLCAKCHRLATHALGHLANFAFNFPDGMNLWRRTLSTVSSIIATGFYRWCAGYIVLVDYVRIHQISGRGQSNICFGNRPAHIFQHRLPVFSLSGCHASSEIALCSLYATPSIIAHRRRAQLNSCTYITFSFFSVVSWAWSFWFLFGFFYYKVCNWINSKDVFYKTRVLDSIIASVWGKLTFQFCWKFDCSLTRRMDCLQRNPDPAKIEILNINIFRGIHRSNL